VTRAERLPLLLALVLTLGTGAVDAGSYVALEHVFTANMSGNIALLGIGVATGVGSVLGNLAAFSGFVAGSIAVARFMRRRRAPHLRRVVEALALELVVLLGLTAAMAAADVRDHDALRYAVCFVLAIAMGTQTGVARQLAVPDLNTTVATMTLHDLAAASQLAGGDSLRAGRRAAAVAALFVGAAIGATLDRWQSWAGLAATALVVAATIAIAVAGGSRDR
jgi:uncharacterized membrane protein YoaK (UPF0700 family)